MSEWIEHDGKGMPVDGEVLVFARFGDGAEESYENGDEPSPASYWNDCEDRYNNWIGVGGNSIIAYRVIDQEEAK